MTTIYTWKVESMTVAASEDSLNDVVKSIHWEAFAYNNQYVVRRYGEFQLSSPNPEEFIPFAELTPTIVQGWLIPALGADVQADMDDELAAKASPQISVILPPWL